MLLQFSRVEAVGAGVEVAVLASGSDAPAIVGHDSLADWAGVVEPRQELLRLPVLVGSFPVAVAPDHLWVEAVDDLHQLWPHFVVDVLLFGEEMEFVVEVHAVEPFEERVVDAELH